MLNIQKGKCAPGLQRLNRLIFLSLMSLFGIAALAIGLAVKQILIVRDLEVTLSLAGDQIRMLTSQLDHSKNYVFNLEEKLSLADEQIRLLTSQTDNLEPSRTIEDKEIRGPAHIDIDAIKTCLLINGAREKLGEPIDAITTCLREHLPGQPEIIKK